MFNLICCSYEEYMGNKIKKFTKEEIEKISNDYKSGLKPYELAEKYDRNSSSIINMLKRIGIFQNANTRFTKEDEEFLRNNYIVGNWDAIYKRFPKSSRQSIITKAYKLGIKAQYFYWNDEEIEFLKDNYFNYSLDDLVKHYNNKYTKDAIQTKANRMFGYSTDDDWTNEENELLKQYYSILPIDEVCEKIPNRSKNAIINHSNILGLFSYFYINTYWDNEQDSILINNWKNMTDAELLKLLNKPIESIQGRRRKLRLMRINKDEYSYTDLNKYLRGQIQKWKNDSMEYCNYKCILTGSSDFQIHHVYSFNQIITDLFNSNSNLPKKEFKEYTENELCKITNEFILEQNKHPLGVCIRPDLHELYHGIYGKWGNTPEQWNQFISDYKKGIYNNVA